MITPNDIKMIDKIVPDLKEYEDRIDESIRKFHGTYKYETAVIGGEVPMFIRNIIGRKYKDAGWNYVYHRTSSENAEEPGLTSFIFSTEEVPRGVLNNYHAI